MGKHNSETHFDDLVVHSIERILIFIITQNRTEIDKTLNSEVRKEILPSFHTVRIPVLSFIVIYRRQFHVLLPNLQ